MKPLTLTATAVVAGAQKVGVGISNNGNVRRSEVFSHVTSVKPNGKNLHQYVGPRQREMSKNISLISH